MTVQAGEEPEEVDSSESVSDFSLTRLVAREEEDKELVAMMRDQGQSLEDMTNELVMTFCDEMGELMQTLPQMLEVEDIATDHYKRQLPRWLSETK